jgi:diadenosine tetraphosphate (Ap4A) HIT family hydrolase
MMHDASAGSIDKPVRVWMPLDRWDALVRGEHRPACVEVTGVGRDNAEGYFVTDLAATRLRLQREQHVPGWCDLLLRRHVREPHELRSEERIALCEDVPHLHAHIQPRYHGDPYPAETVRPAPGQAATISGNEARNIRCGSARPWPHDRHRRRRL